MRNSYNFDVKTNKKTELLFKDTFWDVNSRFHDSKKMINYESKNLKL